MAAGALVAYAVSAAALGRGLPEIALSWAGVGLSAATAALLLTAAAVPLLGGGARRPRRVARALGRAGAGLLLLGLPLSLLARDERVLLAGEGQELPGGGPLGGLRVREIRVAPRGEGLLLSKTVLVDAELEDGEALRVALWPPTFRGAWRVTVLRYGFAPGLEWLDGRGEPLATGFVPVGTLPKSAAEAALVSWLPEPQLMLGVGLYPPPVEDLVSPEGTRRHLFLRLQAADLGGVRRDLTAPNAYEWLADGRPERPEWRVQAFAGARKTWEGVVRAGERVALPDGSLRLAPETRLWVELQAVWDPWIWLAAAGAAALLASGALRLATRRARAPRRR
jgi:hypothetical protein